MREAMSEPDRYRAQAAGELRALKKAIDELPASEIDRMVEMARVISTAIEGGKAVFTCGNGGSAADAQHIAGELVGRFRRKKTSGYRAFALTVNSSVVTSIANDYSYDEIFSRQLESVGGPGDVLLALSTSGDSPNVLRAVETAGSLGMTSLAFTGGDGGALYRAAGISFRVNGGDFARIQEIHMAAGHILCGLVEEMVSGGGREISP